MKMLILSGSNKTAELVSSLLIDCFLRVGMSVEEFNLETAALNICHSIFSQVGFKDSIHYHNCPDDKHKPFCNRTTPYAAACHMAGLIDGVEPTVWYILAPKDDVIVYGIWSDIQASTFVSNGFDVLLIPNDVRFLRGNYIPKWIVPEKELIRDLWFECARVVSDITGAKIQEP